MRVWGFVATKWAGALARLLALAVAVAGYAQGPAPLLSTADGLVDNTVQCLA